MTDTLELVNKTPLHNLSLHNFAQWFGLTFDGNLELLGNGVVGIDGGAGEGASSCLCDRIDGESVSVWREDDSGTAARGTPLRYH